MRQPARRKPSGKASWSVRVEVLHAGGGSVQQSGGIDAGQSRGKKPDRGQDAVSASDRRGYRKRRPAPVRREPPEVSPGGIGDGDDPRITEILRQPVMEGQEQRHGLGGGTRLRDHEQERPRGIAGLLDAGDSERVGRIDHMDPRAGVRPAGESGQETSGAEGRAAYSIQHHVVHQPVEGLRRFETHGLMFPFEGQLHEAQPAGPPPFTERFQRLPGNPGEVETRLQGESAAVRTHETPPPQSAACTGHGPAQTRIRESAGRAPVTVRVEPVVQSTSIARLSPSSSTR